MSDSTLQIVLAIIGSGLLTSVVTTIVNLVSKWLDKKNGLRKKIDEFEKKANKNEMDVVRLQMLVLMADYPQETAEIMRVAEHYFHDLRGNWYMTSMFNRWLEENGIAKPEWFDNSK